MSIIYIVIAVLFMVGVALQLRGPRAGRKQRVMSYLFRPRGLDLDQRRFGTWYGGAWDVGEKLNASITEGKARYAHKRLHRRRMQHHRYH